MGSEKALSTLKQGGLARPHAPTIVPKTFVYSAIMGIKIKFGKRWLSLSESTLDYRFYFLPFILRLLTPAPAMPATVDCATTST